MTLRQAFDLLEREGLLKAQRGKGTFVARARVEKNLTEMRGFSEEMLLRGKVPSTRLLTFHVTRPSLAARDFFGFGENEQVYEIRRLRFADSFPLAIEDVELPVTLCPELDRCNLATESLYVILAEKYRVNLARCVDEISAVLPTKEQKTLLGIDRAVALLKMKRRSYASDGQPVELAITLYRGDMHTALVPATRVIGAAE
jgi:GntR family transcriptional regulator